MMETSTLYWIGGVAIVAAAAIYLFSRKKEDPRDIFLQYKSKMDPLIQKLPNDFTIEEWSEQLVSINDETLINWWKKLVKANRNSSIQLKNALISILKKWGIDIPNNKEVLPPRPKTKVNQGKAKMAFINNIQKFVPILDSLLSKSFDLRQWTECIVDVNDPNLTALWHNYVSSLGASQLRERWQKVLASWNLRPDTCKMFTCATQDNIAAYQLLDGGGLIMGVKYKVESPCWVLTKEDDNGNVTKTVVNKGLVTPAM